jgi:replication factor C large subunit
MFEPWAEKYKPSRMEEIVGQPQAIRAMLDWANGWARGEPEKPALLLYGPSGTGKSAAALALAREFGWDLIELNASDRRTFDDIKNVAGTAATTGTLFSGSKGRRMVVLDEADNVHGAADRGGYRAIAEMLERTQNPVILIANDQYSIPANVRGFCLAVNFRKLTSDSIIRVLSRICESEKITAEPLALKVIAETAGGDLRAAINDLQAAAMGKQKLSVKDLAIYKRDREVNIFEFLSKLMRATSAKEARELLWLIDRPPDDAIAWISENVPRIIVDPEDLERVYEALSRADIFLARTRRSQAYRLWGYAGDLMTAGVALSREGEIKFQRYQVPSAGALMGRTRAVRSVRDSLAKKIARHCHTSTRVARKQFLPYFCLIFRHDKTSAAKIAAELDLNEEEISYLKNLRKGN